MLKTIDINYSIGKKHILKNISVDFAPGEFAMILGPNGSGKSSFLKIFSGEINKFGGTVMYNEKTIHHISKEELAKYRAVMSQQPELSFPLTVEEVVMMGRYPHFNFSPNKKDFAICEEVIELMNLGLFKERNYTKELLDADNIPNEDLYQNLKKSFHFTLGQRNMKKINSFSQISLL